MDPLELVKIVFTVFNLVTGELLYTLTSQETVTRFICEAGIPGAAIIMAEEIERTEGIKVKLVGSCKALVPPGQKI